MTTTLTTRLRELMAEAPSESELIRKLEQLGDMHCSAHVIANWMEKEYHPLLAALRRYETLRYNAPTIIRLLEAGDGVEKVGAKILAKLDSETASVTQWDADELREALATLRAAREGAR